MPPDQVWTAMKAAAFDPSYPDWIVLENAVLVDEADHTIEIYRQLRRDYVSPGVKPRREDAEWKLTVELKSPPPPKPAEVVFISRDASLPVAAQREADRYFADVRMLLGLTPQATGSPTSPSSGQRPAAAWTSGPVSSPSTNAPSTPSPPAPPAPRSGAPPPIDLP